MKRFDWFRFNMFMQEHKPKILLGGVVAVITIAVIFGAMFLSHKDVEFMSITGAASANNTTSAPAAVEPAPAPKIKQASYCDLSEFTTDKNITGITLPHCQLSRCDCSCYISGHRPEDKGQACDMSCQEFTSGKACHLVDGNCDLV